MKTMMIMAAMMTAMTMNAATMMDVKVENNSAAKTATAILNPVKTDEGKADKSCEMKYEYKLDAEGRVTQKVLYMKNKQESEWTPLSAYTVFYGQDDTVVTYAQWSSRKESFTLNAQQQHFNPKDYPVVIAAPKK